MTTCWSNPIPQALQQHGSRPKPPLPQPAPSLQPKLEDLVSLDKAAAFTSPVFVSMGLKTS